MVQERNLLNVRPYFFKKKPDGKWCLVQAYLNLNVAIIPPKTTLSRKDELQNAMDGCTRFSELDLVDDCYKLLMQYVVKSTSQNCLSEGPSSTCPDLPSHGRGYSDPCLDE